jgi:hypothetical protein
LKLCSTLSWPNCRDKEDKEECPEECPIWAAWEAWVDSTPTKEATPEDLKVAKDPTSKK